MKYAADSGFVADRAKLFVESDEFVRFTLPQIAAKVIIQVSTNDATSLTPDDLGYDEHYAKPYPRYHVSPYCASGVDTIKENTITIGGKVAMLMIGSLVGNFLHKKHFHYLPESGIFIILGAIYGVIYLNIYGQSAASGLKFDPDFLTLALLPPIIFYSGYCMPSISNFVSNGREILVLAGVGTVMSTLIVGFGLFYCREIGNHSLFREITVWECLAFASLICAVDPVATLATFSALNVDPDLEVLVFGEALLNDAVAIVLYKSFAKFATYGGPSPYFTWGDLAVKFIALTLGSIFIGFMCGVFQSL